MGYQKDHVTLYSPQEGFTLLAKHYRSYHARLTAWEWWVFARFLPRSLDGICVLDVWAGDGRMAQYFVGSGLARYDALDIAEALLMKAPRRVTKINADMNNSPWPCGSETYDLILAFFCQMYVEDWDAWFGEMVRCIGPWGRCIIQYHKERREFVHDIGSERFKIASHYWPEESIIQAAAHYGLVHYTLHIPERQWWWAIHCFMFS
jgi:ubiquinone/menaquinone biosynthesis C-methylase UbiE